MKKRYYFWITIILIISVFAWQKYRIEKYLGGQVKEILIHSSGDHIIFDNVSIRFNSIILNDVRIAAGNKSPDFYFGKVKLGFNPIRFIKSDFDVIASISDVIFSDGSITVDLKSFNADLKNAEDSVLTIPPVRIFEDLWNKYGNDQKIELENFDFNIDLGSFGIKPVMRKLAGILSINNDKIQLVLSGNLLYSEDQNTLLLGNITKDSLSLELKWDKISLADNWPLMRFESLKNPSGTFSGDFILNSSLDEIENYVLSGKSSLNGLGFQLDGYIFQSGKVDFVTDDNSNIQMLSDIVFEKNHVQSTALIDLHHIEKSNFRLKSQIKNFSFLKHLTGVSLKSVDTEIIFFANLFKNEFPWKAKIRSLSPEIEFLKGDSLLFYLSGTDEKITIDNMQLYLPTALLKSDGIYSIAKGNGKLSGTLFGHFPSTLGPLSFMEKPFRLQLGMDFKNAQIFSGYLLGELANTNYRFLDGKLTSDRRHYYLMFNGDSLSQVTGEMVVWNSLLKGRQLRADVALPGSVVRRLGLLGEYLPLFLNAKFDGEQDDFSTALNIQFNKTLRVNINGDYRRQKRDEKFLGIMSFNIGKKIIEGPIDWKNSGTEYHASVEIDNAIKLILSGNQLNNDFIGKLDVNDLSLTDILTPWYPQLQGGNLSSNLNFQNIEENFSLNGNLNFGQVVLNKVGYYDSDIEFSYADDNIDLKKFAITLNNSLLLNASGKYNADNSVYSLAASGNNLDLEYIAHTLFEKKLDASGIGNFDFLLTNNTIGQPVLNANFSAKNGQLAGFPFTGLDFNLSAIDSGNGWQGELDSLIWFHPDDINLIAHGLIPFSGKAIFDMSLDFKGDILKYLPQIDSFFTHGSSQSQINLKIKGDLSRPTIDKGEIVLVDGSLGMKDVIEEIENIKLTVEKKEKDNFIQIKELSALIDNTEIKINAVKSAPESARPLKTWYFKDLNLDFGILVIQTSDRGVPLKIYGPMRRNELGYIDMRGKEPGEKFYFAGPVDAPVARGKALVKNTSITYPFLRSKGQSDPSPAILFLMSIDWDILAIPAKNVHYVNEVKALVDDIIIDMTANPEESALNFSGRLVDKSFKINGRVISNSGLLEYLDFDFRVEQFGVNFNSNMAQPEVYGAAYTTIRDTVGGEDFPRDIYLRLYSIDPLTGQDKIGGAWSDLHFKLETENLGAGETETDILSYLGYSPDKIKNKASSVGGAVADKLIFRPLVRPIENNLESLLGLDVVRVNAVFTKNIFSNSLNNQLDFSNPGNDIYRGRLQGLAMFSQSQLTLGKYLYPNLYFSYTGRLVNIYDATTQLGLSHQFGLEYRLYRNLLFEVEYDLNRYDYQYLGDPVGRPDFRFRIRHSIHF